LKGKDTLKPLFKKADVNGTGELDFAGWKVFSELLKEKMASTYGGESYTLDND